MRNSFFILILLFHLHCLQGFAQQNELSFGHLTIDDGLSQNSVNCIHQDRNGFLWFGTHDGLNRYDGYEFIHYRNERNNSNSISNNYIYDIHEDDDGILWIATFGGGLNSLNPTTGEINRIEMISNDSVAFPGTSLFSICEYPKGILWIGSGEGLIRFDKKTRQANIFLEQITPDGIFEYNYVGIVNPDETGNLWLQCDSGLARFDTKTLTVEYFQRGLFSNAFEMGNILDIERIDNILYIVCVAGLVEINLEEKTDKLLLPATVVEAGGQTPVFQEILPLGNQRFAIGTNLGLIIFNAITSKSNLYQNNAADDKSLSHNRVFSLYNSLDGILWIGTRNGLNTIETEKPNFTHVRSIAGKKGLGSKNVSSFMEQHDSLLWIGTTDGLNLYNKYSNTFKVFRKDDQPTNGLFSNYILCLFEDSKGNNWVGTRGGGFYVVEDKATGGIGFRQIRPVNETLPLVTVHSITESKDGIIWVGTGGFGLWKYNPSNNSVKKYATQKDGTGLSHPYVFTILEDSFGNLWLGTPSGGVNLFNPESERFIYFQNNPENGYSINNDIILTLHQNRQNELWIGTNDGLARLIPKLHEGIFQELSASLANGNDSLFMNFGQDEGLPNSVIYGLLENKNQHLWISTNKGLAEFDMSSGLVVKTFDVSDGLQSNEFNQNAYYQSHEGRFYFGGVNGFSIFHPDSVTSNLFIPPVVLTDFSIFNETVKVSSDASDDEFHLEKAIHLMNEIDLSWKHNVITFEFAALSYISPEKNKFSYMLEGFDKQWVDAGTSRTATYTHLSPGTYVFKVRASNNSGVWNEKGTALKINISTPPWLSWYAYLFYFSLFLSATLLLIRFRINRATRELKIQTQIEKARRQEREDFRKKSAADFHDEAGNKITKITLFTEMARTEINNKIQLEKYLNKIQHNITQLSSGMRDFLWVMDPQHDTLFETISRMKDVGDSMLTETGVRFTIDGMNEGFREIVLPMNTRRDILLIYKEAINNCAKYARASEVVLKLLVVGHSVTISLCDNGIGFDTVKDSKKNNYGLNIMHERAKKIGAKLEINSQLNKGTNILLKFNMPQMGDS